ncbi:hypothetical protein NQ318_015260 [Aromia moschata]|uniref:Cyclic nucleotide-binding domain-containing protein n=1 Tax=Aromia moschata TaxID=1265417 RepID=A0AAV8YHQ4_9CUCU|nr:hypothetical protein NQ318_015260 [Aromia moschata]
MNIQNGDALTFFIAESISRPESKPESDSQLSVTIVTVRFFLHFFFQRMVYPEKLILDQVIGKNPAHSMSSWCSEPLERNSNNIDVGEGRTNNVNSYKSSKNSNNEKISTASSNSNSNGTSSQTSANRQFIQDRIRHLVEAFSTRAQAVRERIETPATPSSISSRETVEQAPVNVRAKLSISFSDKYMEEIPHTQPQGNRLFAGFLNGKIIDPNGKMYVTWMSIAAMAVLYNAWVIPLRSTFPYQTPKNRPIWMSFDYLADFIYLVDMVLIQPRVKYLNEGFWVTDVKLLRNNYIKNKHFKLDLLSLLPLDLLYIVMGPEFVFLRFPRFFKLHTFWEFSSFIDKLLANPYIIRVTKTLMYMMYLIHLNACAYYAFSFWEGIGSNHFVFNGKGNAYIKCFYFATKTATSIGKNPKPTQEIEYMFMTFSWLMGVFVFALLIGQIRDIISTATRSKTEYRKLVDETLEYMRRMNLPQDMQRRVQLWFNYTWETQHTLDENTIMDCLPHKMKTDIAINVHIQTLSKVKLFADCDEALLRELVLQLKSVIYLPGDIICKKGDVGKEMYIVQSGKVQVIGRNESEVLATLSEGSVFGGNQSTWHSRNEQKNCGR